MTRRSRLADWLRSRAPDADQQRERHATWLELFFDLVFVLALLAVVNRLGTHSSPSIGEVAVVVGLFLIIQWAWVGISFYDTRFDPDDFPHRLLVFLASAGAGAIALGVNEVPHGSLLPVGYLIVRGSLLVMYLRVLGSGPAGRKLASIYLAGFGAGWLLWLGSLFLPMPARPMVWIVATAIELLIPWIAIRPLARYPVHAIHLPERLGQFTIILLGSSLTELLNAVPARNPPGHVLGAALVAFVVPVSVWWLYTSFVSTRRDPSRLRAGQAYTYVHAPLGVSLLLLGWALGRTVGLINENVERLPFELRLILGGAIVVRLLCGAALYVLAFGTTRTAVWIILTGTVPTVAAVFAVTDPGLTLILLALVLILQAVLASRNVVRWTSGRARAGRGGG